MEVSSENSLDERPVIASGGGQAVRRRAIRTRDTRWVLGKLVEDCLIREGAVTRRVVLGAASFVRGCEAVRSRRVAKL